MTAPLTKPFSELPPQVGEFALWRFCHGFGDTRFSKQRDPEYNAAHKSKNFVAGYSGWVRVSFLAKTVVVTLIEGKAQAFKTLTSRGKFSTDYEYRIEDDLRITFVKKLTTLLKRIWATSKVMYAHYRDSMKLHEVVDRAFPNTVARAPVLHKPICVKNHPKGMKFESVQERYIADLSRFVKELGSSQCIQFLPLLLDVARSLVNIHKLGIIHNDVKVENILVQRDGTSLRGLLSDFGISLKVYEEQYPANHYKYWDSLQNEHVVHYFTDIYGLAMAIGELLWGIPFTHFLAIKEEISTEALEKLVTEHTTGNKLTAEQQVSHWQAFELINRIFLEDKKLLAFYKKQNLSTMHAYKRVNLLAKQHISTEEMLVELEKLVQSSSHPRTDYGV